MITRTPRLFALLSAGLAFAAADAHAQDPGAARAHYAQCKELLDAGNACSALVECEQGLKAMDLGNLRALTDKARAACVDVKKEARAERRKARDCPDGKVRVAGQCCWEGQTVLEGVCTGMPLACPAGRTLDTIAGICVVEACDGGKTYVDETHCCWEDQVWFDEKDRCIGIPTCPGGLMAEGEQCVPVVPDQDMDGLADADDLCPTVAEDKDKFEDGDGCPEYDNDADGVCDALFAASLEPGAEFVEITCSGADGCPNEPEDLDGFEDSDGCADPDNDGDGILDTVDRCPGDYGVAAHDGCPPPPDYTYQIVGWSGVGLGTALLATGAGLMLSTIPDRDELNQPEVDATRTDVVLSLTEVEAQSLRDTISTKETAAFIAFGTGGAILTAGIVFLVLDALEDDGMSDQPPSQDGLGFSIAPDPTGGRLLLRGTF